MANRTVGLRYIAKAVGVSTSTVSLALRGSKKIGAATRERVIEEAERLGYRPNAKLNELYRQLRLSRTEELESCIAVVVSGKEHFELGRWNRLYDSMKDRASRLGFRLEVFSLDNEDLKPSRLRTILYFRGIQGVVFLNLGKETVGYPEELEEFSTVCMGAVQGRACSKVGLDRFQALFRLLERIQELGYKRPALYFEDCSEEADTVYKSAYFGWCDREIGLSGATPFLSGSDFSESKFADWYFRYRPEAIVGIRAGKGFESMRDELIRRNISLPEELMLATIEGRDGDLGIPGVDEDLEAVGISAIDLLVDCFKNGVADGVPIRRNQAVDGVWVNEDRFLSRSQYASMAGEWRVG